MGRKHSATFCCSKINNHVAPDVSCHNKSARNYLIGDQLEIFRYDIDLKRNSVSLIILQLKDNFYILTAHAHTSRESRYVTIIGEALHT